MDEIIYRKLLADKSLFAPVDGHRIVEVYPQAAADARFKVRPVTERQLISALHGSAGGQPILGGPPSLRLLICSPRVLDQHIWPLPISDASLGEIVDHVGVPSLFPQAICHHIPIATTFESFGKGNKYGLIIRTNLSWTWQYGLAVVHDADTKTTTAILIGLRANEVEEVLHSIHYCLDYIDCPATLPCILMDKALDALVKDAEDRRKSLLEICYGTGLHGFHRTNFKDKYDERDDIDLDVLMQKLTSLSDACAGISAVCKMQSSFIDTVSLFRQQWDAQNATVSSRYAAQRLRFFGQFLSGVESKVLYTQSSAQGQVQTIYTLISQRDSRNHLMLAEATQTLAELSRKDSTDMRIIAAVTLIFLPATFTATFFSTSFLNFSPAGSDHASSWIWLYFVVTALLTAIVLSTWWYSARRQHNKAQAELLLKRTPEPSMEPSTLGSFQPVFDMKASAKVDALRPYLSGSVAQDVFARKVSIATPFTGPERTASGEISPTTTFARRISELHGQYKKE